MSTLSTWPSSRRAEPQCRAYSCRTHKEALSRANKVSRRWTGGRSSYKIFVERFNPSSARAIESCRCTPVVAAAALHTLLSLLSFLAPLPRLGASTHRTSGHAAPASGAAHGLPGRRHQRKLVGETATSMRGEDAWRRLRRLGEGNAAVDAKSKKSPQIPLQKKTN